MGCDIHMCVEVRDDWDDPLKWQIAIGERGSYGQRNYVLFGVLAGVRCHDVPMIPDEPRGLPHDVTPETVATLAGDHTPSWVTLEEIEKFNWDQYTNESIYGKDERTPLREHCADFLDWVRALKEYTDFDVIKPENIRFVFNFDS